MHTVVRRETFHPLAVCISPGESHKRLQSLEAHSRCGTKLLLAGLCLTLMATEVYAQNMDPQRRTATAPGSADTAVSLEPLSVTGHSSTDDPRGPKLAVVIAARGQRGEQSEQREQQDPAPAISAIRRNLHVHGACNTWQSSNRRSISVINSR